jgi:hypothetical protein
MAGTEIYENILHKYKNHSFTPSTLPIAPCLKIKIKTQRSRNKIIPRPLEKQYANEPLSSPWYENQL